MPKTPAGITDTEMTLMIGDFAGIMKEVGFDSCTTKYELSFVNLHHTPDMSDVPALMLKAEAEFGAVKGMRPFVRKQNKGFAFTVVSERRPTPMQRSTFLTFVLARAVDAHFPHLHVDVAA